MEAAKQQMSSNKSRAIGSVMATCSRRGALVPGDSGSAALRRAGGVGQGATPRSIAAVGAAIAVISVNS
jgi:hypothetical protein